MTDSSQLLLRFSRLMRDLDAGLGGRTTFLPWEVELLLDIQRCQIDSSERRKTLRRWERAACRRIERGSAQPLKLSEYLEARARRRAARVS